MFSSSLRKTLSSPGISAVTFFIMAVPVTLAIVAALWLACAVAYDEVRFVRTVTQITDLLKPAWEAAKDPSFGQDNKNLIPSLARRGVQAAGYGKDPLPLELQNPWKGGLRLVADTPATMRIESDMPGRACRRLAIFFTNNSQDLALQKMEAREENGAWRLFYNALTEPRLPDSKQINAACGGAEHVTLALTLRLR